MEFLLEHVPDDEYVELERIIWCPIRKLGWVPISPEEPCDQLGIDAVWYMDRDPKVDEVVLDSSSRSRSVFRIFRMVRFEVLPNRVESFGVHRAGIHHEVLLDTISVCNSFFVKEYQSLEDLVRKVDYFLDIFKWRGVHRSQKRQPCMIPRDHRGL